MSGKRVEWKWADDGSHVHVGDKKFKAAAAKPEALESLKDQWAALTWARRHLVKASETFSTGLAEYTGAWQQLLALRQEFVQANATMRAAAEGVAHFFEPGDVLAQFGSDLETLVGFVSDAVQRLSAPRPQPAAPAPRHDTERPTDEPRIKQRQPDAPTGVLPAGFERVESAGNGAGG